jgi:hypothetical protein
VVLSGSKPVIPHRFPDIGGDAVTMFKMCGINELGGGVSAICLLPKGVPLH